MTATSPPKIYVAGYRGMVGSAIIRELAKQGQTNVVVRTHAELDLTDQQAVRTFFDVERPDQVYYPRPIVQRSDVVYRAHSSGRVEQQNARSRTGRT